MQSFRDWVDWIGTVIDGLGVLTIVAGAVYASVRFLFRSKAAPSDRYRNYRSDMGRAILLGLEFLVAGDIIRTVVVSPTIQNVLTLGLIVLIRTFLSFSLQAELEGRLPWQSRVRGSSQG